LTTLPEQTNLIPSLAKGQYHRSDFVSNGEQKKLSHLLLYVILVMVSLFNIRFRNEFEVSDI